MHRIGQSGWMATDVSRQRQKQNRGGQMNDGQTNTCRKKKDRTRPNKRSDGSGQTSRRETLTNGRRAEKTVRARLDRRSEWRRRAVGNIQNEPDRHSRENDRKTAATLRIAARAAAEQREENRQMARNLTVDQRLRRRWPESDRSGQTVTEEWQECDQNSFRSGADWSSGNGQTKTGCGGRSGRMMT